MPKSPSSAWPPIAAHRPVSAPRPRATCSPKTSPSTCSPPTKPPASSSTAPTIQEGLEAPQHLNRDSRALHSINPKSSISSSPLGIILRTMRPSCDPTDLAFFFHSLGIFLVNENDRTEELRLTIFDNGFQEFILRARINSCSSEQCSLKNIRPQEKIHHKISDIFMFQKTKCIVTKSTSR